MYLILLLASMAAIAAEQRPDGQPEEGEQQVEAPDSKRVCRDVRGLFARDDARGGGVQTSPPPRLRRLDELPSGNLELAVMREVDGCIEPTIIAQGFGAVAPPEQR